LTIRANNRSRSGPEARVAVTGTASRAIWIVAWGLLRRLSHQAGCRGEPPLDATITNRSPSRWYINGLVQGRPDLRPVVVSSRTGAPNIVPPSRPPLVR
jgi:hypothetical protein